MRSARERERERERNTETDGSDVTIVPLKLAMSLHVPCQHTYTFVAKNVALFETVRINYRKRGSASYIVREVLLVRERERDTERKREREKER